MTQFVNKSKKMNFKTFSSVQNYTSFDLQLKAIFSYLSLFNCYAEVGIQLE